MRQLVCNATWHCVAPPMGSIRRPAYEDSSDTATSSGEDSDSGAPEVGRSRPGAEHWRKRHTGVLVDSCWAAAQMQVERALWSELVARAVSELDVESATEHAQQAAAASLPPSHEARDSRLVTRVVGRYDSSDEDGGSRGSSGVGSDSDGASVRRKPKTATDLYRASKARSVADAELLRPRVAPERAQPSRENREGAAVLALGAPVQMPHRPRGWPREWSSSWAKVHHRRRHAPAALQPVAQALLADDLT
jgi:hypothetical protein